MLTKKQERLALVERQIGRLERRLVALDALNNRYWRWQLFDFFITFICTTLISRVYLLVGVLCIPLGIIAFFWLNRAHDRVRKSFLRHKYLLQAYELQRARLKLEWEKLPEVSSGADPSEHPFELDLDITGARSLLRLLNTGVSLEGEARLRSWLLAQVPDLPRILERQGLVSELAPLTRFRDKLMANSLFATRTSFTPLEGEKLLRWLQLKGPENSSVLTLIVPSLLSIFALTNVVLFLNFHTPLAICLLALLSALGWYLATRKQRGTLSVDASYLRNTFGQLQVIFEYLEKYPYARDSFLEKLCEPFFSHARDRPSILFKRLARVASFAVLENSDAAGLLINTLVPVDVYVAYFLQRYRARITKLLPQWLEIWYELEALSSLANFAYLNPDYTQPQFLREKDVQEKHMLFSARNLGHPLLPPEKKVLNDYTMDTQGTLLLLTGSNMAGKSTFLRTIGLNLCLAYAGAPVNAGVMETVLFELAGCIRVADSVTDGYSYFYAEVRRLRAILERVEAGTRYPLFFLIDEIFKGTNNRERLIGSTAYIHALAGKNCVGAISTHDLDLVKLADTLPQIRNYHFREDLINGKMVFAYKLRQGPCPTTNALKIMEMEGLPTTY